MTDSTTIEHLRVGLLQTLRTVAPHPLPVGRLVMAAKLSGFASADADFVARELSYLADKKLVTTEAKTISPENREWRITADGRDYLATQGL